jgi:hypothetical protein
MLQGLLFSNLNRRNKNLFFSSSDSDSDPEGGELPDIIYPKEKQKKKFKKKRSEKAATEERVQKLNHKRQVSIISNVHHTFL